jgi:hypothetical protein
MMRQHLISVALSLVLACPVTDAQFGKKKETFSVVSSDLRYDSYCDACETEARTCFCDISFVWVNPNLSSILLH